MGQCCAKCLLSNTCCLCWCGCCTTYVTHGFDKVMTLDGKNHDMKILNNEEQLKKDMLTWKTGDIILQHSDTSPHTLIYTNSPWTHVGVIYNRNDNPEILKKTDDYGNESCTILSIEALNNGYSPQGEYGPVGKFSIADATKWIHTSKDKHCYIAHRRLKEPLSNEQLKKLEESIDKLRNAKYGGFSLEDYEAVRAANDFGCCYCCKENSNKENIQSDTLFCSKAAAILLQDCGILDERKNKAFEYMPNDFTEKNIWMYTKDEKDPYGDIVGYGV